MTRKIAGDLVAHGFVILSGLALGIDGAAHQAALNSGGRTWGFLASGFGQMYPPENEGLAEEIVERGAVVSEFTMNEKALRSHFPSRNRLISGASLGVLVVQAPKKSGALITARYAMEQNREVFALPGRVDERASEGPHQLIQDGAKLVHDVEDILEEIGSRVVPHPKTTCEGALVTERKTARSAKAPNTRLEKAQPRKTESASPGKRFEDLEPDDRRIALRLEAGPVHVDRLAADLDLPVRKVSERLLHLEMKGVVLRLPGMSFDLA
jgi:DNA processing protein